MTSGHRSPVEGTDTWVALVDGPLPVTEVTAWAKDPSAGASVVFTGSVRDHSEGRPGVRALTYDAYEEWVEPKLREIVGRARARWPGVLRAAALHRWGKLGVGEDAVVVAVATPHRAEAFEAARFVIDAIKAEVPLWKYEQWQDGAGWSSCSHGHLQLDRPPVPAGR
jgi:molybdopterin synthase catalytic subunit